MSTSASSTATVSKPTAAAAPKAPTAMAAAASTAPSSAAAASSATAPTSAAAAASAVSVGVSSVAVPKLSVATSPPKGSVFVQFDTNFHTQYGEVMVVVGNHSALGDWNAASGLKLNWNGDGNWSRRMTLSTASFSASSPAAPSAAAAAAPSGAGAGAGAGAAGTAAGTGPAASTTVLEYKYAILRDDGGVVWEGGDNRVIDIASMTGVIHLRESWRPTGGVEELFNRGAFSQVIFSRTSKATAEAWRTNVSTSTKSQVRFQVYAPNVAPNQQVYVSGSTAALGNWHPASAVALNDAQYPLWTATVPLDDVNKPFLYKFFVTTDGSSDPVWEEGEARTVSPAADELRSCPEGVTLVHTDGVLRSSTNWRGAGMAIPVFSLRTKSGLGVGEFLDIKLAVDWARKCNLSLLQILPINDTCVYNTWRDSYPYRSVSVFALHPIYINIPFLAPYSAQVTNDYNKAFAALTADPTAPLDYEAVMDAKISLMRQIFKEQKEKTFASAEYKTWFADNCTWLQPYALFCLLRDLHGVADPSQWGARSKITMEEVQELTAPGSLHYDAIGFWFFIQYHLHLQLLSASQYAASNGVVLKGDLPIGVAKEGVDAWLWPHLFNMDTQTGAPPDDFSANGQNWGFPTYNWEAMAQDGYLWWRQRLTQMSSYFQAYRIDHILGFFRIWQIPSAGTSGLLGRFYPAHPLRRWELESRGIWDFERLVKPYIREWTLEQHFGWRKEGAKRYLNHTGNGCYELKHEFNTEQKIEHNAAPADGEFDMRPGLKALVTNVCLLAEGYDFVPRISMEKTSSFYELNAHYQGNLKGLYDDYFFKRQEVLWREKAMQKLPALKAASDMLVCGEDLGMVPACVPGVMKELSILSLAVQRMPGDPEQLFGIPSEYGYMSVCTTSSHDTSTLRGWWEEDREKTQQYYNHVLKKHGAAPATMDAKLATDILVDHLNSASMWAIFPIQDFLAMDETLRASDPTSERINEPSNEKHYWRWRMHVSMEQLLGEGINDSIADLVTASGRGI